MIIFVATNVLSRQNTSFVVTKVCLSRQKSVFIFVTTKLLLRQIFVATNTFLSQQKFCYDKHIFVATKVCLSRQNYVCHDKTFVAIKIFCSGKHDSFVATKVILGAAGVIGGWLLFVKTVRPAQSSECRKTGLMKRG